MDQRRAVRQRRARLANHGGRRHRLALADSVPSMKKSEMMMVNIRDLIASLILIAMGATANAQLLDDCEQGSFKVGSITYEGPEPYWFDEEIEFCPSTCYTDVIQRTVIRCEATLGRSTTSLPSMIRASSSGPCRDGAFRNITRSSSNRSAMR